MHCTNHKAENERNKKKRRSSFMLNFRDIGDSRGSDTDVTFNHKCGKISLIHYVGEVSLISVS